MKPIRTLITTDVIQGLASRSNFRYGKEIAREEAVHFKESNAFHVVADVQFRGGELQIVDLQSTPKGFRWKCSCTGKKGVFCEHAVAASIALVTPTDSTQEEL